MRADGSIGLCAWCEGWEKIAEEPGGCLDPNNPNNLLKTACGHPFDWNPKASGGSPRDLQARVRHVRKDIARYGAAAGGWYAATLLEALDAAEAQLHSIAGDIAMGREIHPSKETVRIGYGMSASIEDVKARWGALLCPFLDGSYVSQDAADVATLLRALAPDSGADTPPRPTPPDIEVVGQGESLLTRTLARIVWENNTRLDKLEATVETWETGR